VIRWALRIAALGAVVVGGYLAVTLAQIWQQSRRDEARPAQAIVVFGAAQYNGRPSPVLKARLDHAAALYRRGLAPVVVVTGGKEPGDRVTEAAASADYLAGVGVPQSDVLREVRGRTSWQSLSAASAFLRARGVRRVVLVSDGFHALRVKAMASALGLVGFTSPARGSPLRGWGVLPYFAKETAAVAVGRVIGFRRAAGIDQRVRGV
jgi:uncharacterized SAM-binding protein YcdF (DUF218 family)